MSKFFKLWFPLIIIVGSVAGTAVVLHNRPADQQPSFFRFVDDKLKSIITPKAPIGNLTPARDLRGTWVSSLAGKGLQVYGKFETGPAITTIYEDGDLEIIIDSVENNIASGKIRFTNLCANSVTTAPNIKTITVKKCVPDTGYMPTTIRVSGSALDFGTINTNGASITMQGSFTTDLIHGSMTAQLSPYGTLKGVFNLMRK